MNTNDSWYSVTDATHCWRANRVWNSCIILWKVPLHIQQNTEKLFSRYTTVMTIIMTQTDWFHYCIPISGILPICKCAFRRNHWVPLPSTADILAQRQAERDTPPVIPPSHWFPVPPDDAVDWDDGSESLRRPHRHWRLSQLCRNQQTGLPQLPITNFC